MENDIPKIDLPQDWVIGKLSIEDRGIHQLNATQGRTRKLHHHHARINPADP